MAENSAFMEYLQHLPQGAPMFIPRSYGGIENKQFDISRLAETAGKTVGDKSSSDNVYTIRIEPLEFRDEPPDDEIDPEVMRRRLLDDMRAYGFTEESRMRMGSDPLQGHTPPLQTIMGNLDDLDSE